MPLASFQVENYRSFMDRTRIDVRPLTLLFGYNSAGKSALLRFLPIVSAAVEPGAEGILNLRRSPAAREAAYNDIRCRLSNRDELGFSLEWDDATSFVRAIEVRFLDLVNLRRQIVHKIRAVDATGSFHTVELELPESEAGTLSRYALNSGGHQSIVDLDFDGLVPSLRDKTLSGPSFAILADISGRLRSLQGSVHWIGSLRTAPLRHAPLKGPVKRLDQDGRGGGAVEMLAYNPDALLAASNWYETSTNHRLELQRSAYASDELASPVLSPKGAASTQTPVQIAIADTGEGMAQVLPVVVLASMAKLGHLGGAPLLAVEQPELHLHPRAHEHVATLFCELAQSGSSRVLVETHSENFLLRIQLAILKGELSPERVIVYWVRQMADGASVAEPILFDELARPMGDAWPQGVFSEDVDQARRIAQERRQRGMR